MVKNEAIYSRAIESGLIKAGKRVTDTLLAKALQEVESYRVHFGARAVALGILLEAKKASMRHGSFRKYMEDLLAANIKTSVTRRHADNYRHLARRYLLALEMREQGDPRSTLTALAAGNMELCNKAASLAEMAIEAPEMFADDISKWIAGRTLSEMLTDFNEADKGAREEEAAHGRVIDAETGKPLAGDPAAGQTKGGDQLLFKFAHDWQTTVSKPLQHNFAQYRDAIRVLPARDALSLWERVQHDLKKATEEAENIIRGLRTAADTAPETLDPDVDAVLAGPAAN